MSWRSEVALSCIAETSNLTISSRRPDLFGLGLDPSTKSFSNPAAREENDDDDKKNDAESARGGVAPPPAMRPGWYRAKKQQDENDQKNC